MGKTYKNFNVGVRLNALVSIDIKATDFDDALAQAKALDLEDFVEIKGEWVDDGVDRIETIFLFD